LAEIVSGGNGKADVKAEMKTEANTDDSDGAPF